MADLTQILQGVASGLLTGGASAGTTFLTVFKAIKSRIADLEKKVGDPEADPKTGLFYSVDAVAKAIRNLRLDIESWRDDPPEWLIRIVQRANRGTMPGNEALRDLEERVDSRLRGFRESLDRLDEDLDRREEKLQDEIQKSSPEHRIFVMRDEYEEDSRRRSDEIRKIQQNLASANSFLRGVMAALGYVDDPQVPMARPPTFPARPIPKPTKK